MLNLLRLMMPPGVEAEYVPQIGSKWVIVTEQYKIDERRSYTRRFLRLRDRSRFIPAGPRCNVAHTPKHLRAA